MPGVELMVGLFINTLPERAYVRPEAALLSWLKEVQESLAELREYEYSPLVDIHGWSEVSRNQPLFESIVVFGNYPADTLALEKHLHLTVGNVRSYIQNSLPLTVRVVPGQESVHTGTL